MNNHKFCEDLLAKMTVEEKVAQLSCVMAMLVCDGETVSEEKLKKLAPNGLGRMTQFSTSFVSGAKSVAKAYNDIQRYHVENTRLGIPILIQNESACGLVAAQASSFPIPLALASSWQPELTGKMGEIISEQARAVGVRKCLSPVADVARDQRWGRVGETFGEDPTLVTAFSVAESGGLQQEFYGDHVISCAKHFMGYGASETGINCAEINVGKRELREVYGTPFAAMIHENDLQSVMVTYSEIDGYPMSVNDEYINEYLRGDLGFTGSAICDAMSIPRAHNSNGVGRDEKEIAVMAAKVGIDADTPVTSVYQLLVDAVKDGTLPEADLDRMVLRVLNQKKDLGLFENPYVDEEKAQEIFAKPEGDLLSKEISEKSMILLKNDDQLLPLKDVYHNIAFVGPFADRLSTLFGGYAYPSMLEMLVLACYNVSGSMEGGFGDYFRQFMDPAVMHDTLGIDNSLTPRENLDKIIAEKYHIKTLYQEAKDIFKDANVTYAKGYSTPGAFEEDLAQAKAAAADSDVIVLCLGEITGMGDDATSGEGKNTPDLRLPGRQAELVKEMKKLGKPMVLVLFNGRGLELTEVIDDVDAVLEVWYPGPHGGSSIAKALHGDINPGGRLPVTFPTHSAQCPLYYGHKAGSGYRVLENDGPKETIMGPLFHFGHGLSYTTFAYSDLEVSPTVEIMGEVKISFKVTNTGDVAGDETAQVYF
ncbi:MAG: glycoside hydrolase family 3 C-terminal domain-containing protein, partial [Lachnospiraceae bacterium]|nr:glycoside hydrolase family 3 C-terminal domain-containing protein [Lachnospiraceae bacterium]